MQDVVTRSAEREHRVFSPSQSERFFNCIGSTNLIARTPSRATSVYAEEGQIAHDVLEAALRQGARHVFGGIKHSGYRGHPLTVGYTDFHYSIQDALDYIWELVDELDLIYGDVTIFVERYVEVPSFAAPGEAGGFSDICIYSPSARRLWVIDYKHGVGIAKAAQGNTQVSQYAAGFLYEENPQVDPNTIDLVTLVIIQPRAFHPDGDIREWHCKPDYLVDYLMRMDEAIEASRDPHAPLTVGLSWCQFCEARSSCPALAQSAAAAILNDLNKLPSDINQNTIPDIKNLDLGRMAYIKSMKPMINLWLESIDKHLDELSRRGVEIPGHKRVETVRKRKYDVATHKNKEAIAVGIAALIGCKPEEVFKERELLNITDMEEKIVGAFKSRAGRGKKKQAAENAAKMFAYFTVKEPSGNTVLVPLEDRRPAINKAQFLFSDVKVTPTPNQGT